MVINPNISSATRSVVPLPSKYTNVPPAALKSKEFTVPSVNGPVALHTLNNVEEAKMDKLQWLNEVMAALEKEQLDPADWISWSSYHAALQQAEKHAAISSLRLTCSLSAVHVGVMFSKLLDFWVKSCFLASLTCSKSLVRL